MVDWIIHPMRAKRGTIWNQEMNELADVIAALHTARLPLKSLQTPEAKDAPRRYGWARRTPVLA